ALDEARHLLLVLDDQDTHRTSRGAGPSPRGGRHEGTGAPPLRGTPASAIGLRRHPEVGLERPPALGELLLQLLRVGEWWHDDAVCSRLPVPRRRPLMM